MISTTTSHVLKSVISASSEQPANHCFGTDCSSSRLCRLTGSTQPVPRITERGHAEGHRPRRARLRPRRGGARAAARPVGSPRCRSRCMTGPATPHAPAQRGFRMQVRGTGVSGRVRRSIRMTEGLRGRLSVQQAVDSIHKVRHAYVRFGECSDNLCQDLLLIAAERGQDPHRQISLPCITVCGEDRLSYCSALSRS